MKYFLTNLSFLCCVLALACSSLFIVGSVEAYSDSESLLTQTKKDCAIAKTVEVTLHCYLPVIIRVSDELNIDPALALAIIHQESHFKISAISHANALGLMQLKSETAANDVVKKLSGHDIILPKNYLLEPTKNIAIGIRYIALLKTDYLAKITNSHNQRLAIIAAYNGGIGTLKRWFKSDVSSAIENINRISPTSFKQALLTNHPFKETRDYIRTVELHYEKYRKILGQHNVLVKSLVKAEK
jgi:peptidoglycan lytic transglycosylase C